MTKHWGEHAAALVACCGSVVSLVLVIQFVPEFQKPQEEESKTAIFDVKKILGLFTLPGVGTLMLVKTVCGIPLGIFQSMFSVIAMEQFKLSAEHNGMVMSYLGALSMLM